jgi:hypothetical protein
MLRYSPTISIALLLIAFAGPAAAQTPPDQSAPANVRQSQQYEQALRTNPSFRAKRMQEECGPIADAELHQQCVASFEAYGPVSPPRPRRP